MTAPRTRNSRSTLSPALGEAEPPPGACIVYDAEGRPIAWIDPTTRRRHPAPPPDVPPLPPRDETVPSARHERVLSPFAARIKAPLWPRHRDREA